METEIIVQVSVKYDMLRVATVSVLVARLVTVTVLVICSRAVAVRVVGETYVE